MRESTKDSLANVLLAFVMAHPHLRGVALWVDVSTLYHARNPTNIAARLIGHAFANPHDADAVIAAYRSFLCEALIPGFLRRLPRAVREFFKINFVFEHSSSM